MAGGGKGGGSSEIKVTNSGTTNVNATTDIVGLDDIKARAEIDVVRPIVTQSTGRTELAITEPIVTQNTSTSSTALSLDIRPMVIDACTRIEFGSLPETCIRQPYQKHFGFTLFGIEIMGFTMHCEEQFIIQNLPSKPQVAWGGVESHPEPRPPRRQPVSDETGGGLRIRLAD